MKLQNLTVIFAVIIIPITLILSAYIGTQIDTASLQQSYDTTLMDATHDAVVAFELNTANDDYSTDTESIRRDIRAAINTFSTSLAIGLGIPGANTEAIMPYVPAILVTLYDGYYIYSPSEYTYNTKELNQSTGSWEDKTKTGYTHILKPYVYYSAKYQDGNDYVVVNYSLDNYISLYGNIGGTVINKSGYLGHRAFLDNIDKYDAGEQLNENIVYKQGNDIYTRQPSYVYIDGKKVYEINGKNYTLTGLNLMEYKNDSINTKDYSAKNYRNKSRVFTNDIQTNYNNNKSIASIVTPKNQVGKTSKDTTKILLTDPEDPASLFNQHKRQVIRESIQDNLNNAMAIYNANSESMEVSANFQMPKLSETDWEKILTNVNFVTFMQGLPVGNKLYNNYSIITSTNNKQYIDPTSIYFIGSDDKYHTIYCDKIANGDINIKIGYKSQDFKKVKYEDSQGSTQYYYRRPEYACYDCKVTTSSSKLSLSEILESNPGIKQKYYTALARERYNLDKVTKVFMR